jgi:hypothetical protein
MSYDVPLRFRQRFALEISKLQETVGQEVTRTCLSFLSYAAEATTFEPDHRVPSSRPEVAVCGVCNSDPLLRGLKICEQPRLEIMLEPKPRDNRFRRLSFHNARSRSL